MTKKIAVVLSGSGFLDGSEIHEAVLTLLHIYKQGAEPIFFAPDVNQTKAVNHLTRELLPASRSMIEEAARIARGNISPLKNLQTNDFSALVFPGGFGAATNLCDFGTKGADCQVRDDVRTAIENFYTAKKPIGVICIAPVLVARVLATHGVSLTLGSICDASEIVTKWGVKHIVCRADEFCVDEKNKIVSTPAYMVAKNPAEFDLGISGLVHKILEF